LDIHLKSLDSTFLRCSLIDSDSIFNATTYLIDLIKERKLKAVYIKVGTFNQEEHDIEYMEDSKYFVRSIDGQRPLGLEGAMPLKELSEIKIVIDNKEVEIPASAYSNIFYPRLCNGGDYFDHKVEVYNSISGKYLYVYFYGGESASTFFGKLVFDKEKYITKIFTEYNILGSSCSFRKEFLGF